MVGLWFLALLVVSILDAVAASLQAGSSRRAFDTFRSHGFPIGLGFIALIGIAVRLVGVDWDLGHVPIDVDEKRLATTVLHFFVTGEVNHATVEDYPGLLFWLLTASYVLAYLTSLMEGTAHNLGDAPLEIFVLGGRVTNVLLTAGTIVFVGSLGRMVGGRRAGLVAALVVAVAPLSVVTSGQLRDEAAQSFFVVATVWAAVKLARPVAGGPSEKVNPPWQDARLALLAGGLAGIATAIKYSSVFALLPVLGACVLAPAVAAMPGKPSWEAAIRRAGLALFAFVAAVATTNHFVWSDFPNFIVQLTTEVAMSGPHHWSAQANPRWFYSRILGTQGPGWALLVLAAGYTVWGLGTGERVSTILLAFPVSYMWFMTQRHAQFARWIYPLVPFVAIAGAAMLWALCDRVQPKLLQITRGNVAVVRWLATSLAIAALVQPLWRGLVLVNRIVATPTQTLVEVWLRSHTNAGDRVLVPEGWLDFKGTALRVNRVPSLGPILGGGIYQLRYNDWVVVPEPDMWRTGELKRLRLAETFLADSSSHGNLGYDFAVYATDRLQASDETVDFALEKQEAQNYLGSEWPLPEAGRGGRDLPRGGASVFLPPLGYAAGRLEMELQVTPVRNGPDAGGEAPDDTRSAAIAVKFDDQPLAADKVLSDGTRIFWLSVPISSAALGRRVVRVRLIPHAASTAVRVLRFAVRK